MGIEIISKLTIFNDTQVNVEAETGALVEICFGRNSVTGGIGYSVDAGANWIWLPLGDVIGPSTSTDGHLVVWDGMDSKTIKDGGTVASAGGELLMQDGVTSPPVPLEMEDGTDWLYEG